MMKEWTDLSACLHRACTKQQMAGPKCVPIQKMRATADPAGRPLPPNDTRSCCEWGRPSESSCPPYQLPRLVASLVTRGFSVCLKSLGSVAGWWWCGRRVARCPASADQLNFVGGRAAGGRGSGMAGGLLSSASGR